MPFVWKTLAPAGIVLGNQAKGSKVTVRNDQWFSYPGYSEILTGQAQPDVKSNDLVRYPHRTVLEYVRDSLSLSPTQVAQIGSWDGFKYAASSTDGAFFMSGARDPVPAALSDARDRPLQWPAPADPAALGREQQRRAELPDRDRVPEEAPAARDVARARPVGRLGARAPLRPRARLPAPRGRPDRRAVADAPVHGRIPRPHDAHHHDRPRSRAHARGLGGARRRHPGLPGHLDRDPRAEDSGARRSTRLSGSDQGDVAATMLQYLGLDGRDFNARGRARRSRAASSAE